MLDAIDTGYEGKFDFAGQQPEAAYLLATVPRTGSTYLSHLLWRSGCLGAPLEYLNFEPSGPFALAAGSPGAQRDLWQRLLWRRTSPNGVFGLKAFPMQLQALVESNPPLLQAVFSTLFAPARPPRVVWLGRRDRAAHLVSYARATMSGVWRQEQETGEKPEIDYSDAALETAGRWIDFQADAWEAMFADMRIEPLRLWYEDVVAEPEAAVAKVAAFVGVALDPKAAIEVPEIRKQSESEAIAWVERYMNSRGG